MKEEQLTSLFEEKKKEMEALIKQEAAYKQAEPADDIAIETAKSSFGDYKLKMSPQYQVSEKDRVNAEKK